MYSNQSKTKQKQDELKIINNELNNLYQQWEDLERVKRKVKLLI